MLMNLMIWLDVVVLVAILPGLVLIYRLWQVPRRWDEINRILRDDAAKAYLAAFAQGTKGQKAREFAREQFNTLHSWRQYLLATIVVIVLASAGLAVCGLWIRARLDPSNAGGVVVARIETPLIMAFLGGYVWSVHELVSRRSSGSFTPDTVYHVAFRLLASVPIGYAFSLLGVQQIASFLAFGASAFPIRDLRRMVRQHFLGRLTEVPVSAQERDMEDRLAWRVFGLSGDKLAHLEEVSITSAQDLAYADPIRLHVETGFPIRSIIDWIDQALLAIYVGGKIHELPRRGIRGVIEANQLFDDCCIDENGEYRDDATKETEIKDLATVLGVKPHDVVRLLWQIEGDPHVKVVEEFWYPNGTG